MKIETICKQLDIPFHQVDFVKEYWLNVFSPSLEVWRRGGLNFLHFQKKKEKRKEKRKERKGEEF